MDEMQTEMYLFLLSQKHVITKYECLRKHFMQK